MESEEGTFICKICGQPIDGENYRVHKEHYHKGCFNCSSCSQPLNIESFKINDVVLSSLFEF